MLNKYSTTIQAALGFMILNFLFKITFELDGARQISALPVLQTVYLFIGLLIATIVLTLVQHKSGYVLGIIYGGLNILAALFIIVTNHLPAGNSVLKPINVITSSFLIVYFCFLEYRKSTTRGTKETHSSFLS